MARQRKNSASRQTTKSVTSNARAKRTTRPKSKVRHLPQYRLLLHNDDLNDMDRVVLVVNKVTPLPFRDAIDRMLEAHRSGVALLLVTHKELAELYVERLRGHGLIATIEPIE